MPSKLALSIVAVLSLTTALPIAAATNGSPPQIGMMFEWAAPPGNTLFVNVFDTASDTIHLDLDAVEYYATDCAISPDGRYGYEVDYPYGEIAILDMSSSPPVWLPTKLRTGGRAVNSFDDQAFLALTPDGKYLIQCDFRDTASLTVFDTTTLQIADVAPSWGLYCHGLDVCPDGTVLFSDYTSIQKATIDGAGHISLTGQNYHTTPYSFLGVTRCAPDSKTGVALADHLARVMSFSTSTMQELDRRELSAGDVAVAAAFDPQAQHLFVRADIGGLDAFGYDRATGAIAQTPSYHLPLDFYGQRTNNFHLAVSADGSKLYTPDGVAGHPEPGLDVFDTSNGDLLGIFHASRKGNPGTTFCFTPPPPIALHVRVAVRPDSEEPTINLRSFGKLTVGVYGSDDVDVADIDLATVTLAGAPIVSKGNGQPMVSLEDLDGDGLTDLVLHFETADLQISSGDTAIHLEGKTLDGTPIEGDAALTDLP